MKLKRFLVRCTGVSDNRVQAEIIEKERQRINLTATTHECIVDEDCEVCQMMAVEFIDTPMFVHYDGSNMEYDRYEFSFYKTREGWEKEQHEMDEFNREFERKYRQDDEDLFEEDEIIF